MHLKHQNQEEIEGSTINQSMEAEVCAGPGTRISHGRNVVLAIKSPTKQQLLNQPSPVKTGHH
jgi:hypothetical protein